MTTTSRSVRPLPRLPATLVALLLALASTATARADGAAVLAAGSAQAASGALKLALATDEGTGAAHREPVWYHLRPPFENADWQPPPGGSEKSPFIALGEVVGINIGMWFVSYWAGNEFSKISFTTIGDNFRKGWIIDTDPYWVNSFGHPYEGSAFYTAARSTGHNFYESLGFAFLGSLMWEQFMEVQSPSLNDQVQTPFGGAVLGEVLYRVNRLILDSGGAKPSGWRQFAAFVVSPVAGANRFLFGDKYQGPPLLPPSWAGEFNFGLLFAVKAEDLRAGTHKTTVGPWVSIGAHLNYGVPGSPDLRLKQPFDHFDFLGSIEFTNQAQRTATLLMRGLLVGETIGPATDWGGLWGLFGSYDVISVPNFSASGFGLGPGVSLMKRWGTLELHGTALAEVLPWASGGEQDILFARDYHTGPGAVAVLDGRAFFGNQATLDLQLRDYLISGAYARGQSEDLAYGRAALTVRIYGPHGVNTVVGWTWRHATFPHVPEVSERGTFVSAHYTLMDGW